MADKKKTRSIEASIEIDAPIEAVWRALTDNEELTRWFPLEAGENPDGTSWMSFGEDFKFTSRVEIVEPGRRVRAEEVSPRSDAGGEPIATDITLETRGGKTVLRLVHSGFSADADWDEMYDGTRRGWDFELRGLRHYLERHRGTPRRVIWVRKMIVLPVDEAWKRLFSPEGLLAGGTLDNPGEGDRYELMSRQGMGLSGTVHIYNPPRDFAATVDLLNDAFLRVRFDEYGGRREVNFWISTYGLDATTVDRMQSSWQGMISSLF